jgi:IS605 OrfB family transposase
LEIISNTRKSAQALNKKPSKPFFKGQATLDAKFITIEPGKKTFDLVIRLSILNKNHRIIIPTRKTAVLNKWLNKPLNRLIQSVNLGENFITVCVESPVLEPRGPSPIDSKRVLGIDIGVNKLIASSDGKFYGKEFKAVRDKVNRRKPGSKSKLRARTERDQYINHIVNQLPYDKVDVIGIETLKNLKRGKYRGRGKIFRKAMAPWTYRRVTERIGRKAQENRVLLVAVPAPYTSQTCPMCGTVSKENRKGEHFRCMSCGHTADADTVGALNVFARTLATIGRVESPVLS